MTSTRFLTFLAGCTSCFVLWIAGCTEDETTPSSPTTSDAGNPPLPDGGTPEAKDSGGDDHDAGDTHDDAGPTCQPVTPTFDKAECTTCMNDKCAAAIKACFTDDCACQTLTACLDACPPPTGPDDMACPDACAQAAPQSAKDANRAFWACMDEQCTVITQDDDGNPIYGGPCGD